MLLTVPLRKLGMERNWGRCMYTYDVCTTLDFLTPSVCSAVLVHNIGLSLRTSYMHGYLGVLLDEVEGFVDEVVDTARDLGRQGTHWNLCLWQVVIVVRLRQLILWNGCLRNLRRS